ncbi:hypothetical protein CANCADRAFT_117644 [Tortispora caseinolytica NRRL Y-17796]|uniref:Coatomer subunit alpha n=1 Tax=Tortispora caseinolytica NRRL Y-17796 TaxID=767744 RepID=A0A1E4THD3_9ASCO|nr:hypothetical protein CANCADRAFT_117644 [Tortispora caseinolytica NRRL Y-17796]
MQMLTKFESKSSRAKGLAFHPKRPLLLVSMHTSKIQLWDYRMGTLLDRFEEHDGPVRGVSFHPTQDIFVSGSDDYKIKVWSLTSRKCLFTLTGHLDYVRTVFFHPNLPWIISASDDQTIRIWNWQNRSQIACLTGHNHYVMCAQFHPTEDLVVSASLDQTVRVWDISGLCRKHSAPTSSMSFEDQMARAAASAASSGSGLGAGGPNADIFGANEAIVKYVLEGHERGVNWAAFHPTMPLIVSGGDDRLVKLWRMSDTRAWEVDTCRGHFSNVSCCIFHPHYELIVSVGEDKTIRTWDLNRRTAIHTFRRDSDRFWVVTAHPTLNLLATGHDTGAMVFKFQRERPAYTLHQSWLFWLNNEKQLISFDFESNRASNALLSLKRIGASWIPPRTLSYNPSEKSILVHSPIDGGTYFLTKVSGADGGFGGSTIGPDPTDISSGPGSAAIFVSRNRFVVLSRDKTTLEVKDLANTTTKSLNLAYDVLDLASAGSGNILLLCKDKVVLFDTAQNRDVATKSCNKVKYASWSPDSQYLALLSKHSITVVDRNLELVAEIHEVIRIKSVAWDDSGILIYTTLNHLRFGLMNGDKGILKSLDDVLYVVRSKGKNIFCLSRDGKVVKVEIDPTEYRFKNALLNKNYTEMKRIMENSNLVGQSIISYIEQKGFNDIALQFVEEPQVRFDLSIKCGDLGIAFDMAKEIDKAPFWKRLVSAAEDYGNHEIKEFALQKLHAYEKLSLLYLITGNEVNSVKMSKIAEHRHNPSARLQTLLFSNNIEGRIELLEEAGLFSLAYATAKTNGMAEKANAIASAAGLNESDIILPVVRKECTAPTIKRATYKANYPLQASKAFSLDKTIIPQFDNLNLLDDSTDTMASTKSNGKNVGSMLGSALADDAVTGGEDEWGLEEDDLDFEEDFADEDSVVPMQTGVAETDLWVRNSPIAADHIAAGSFESAMQLLNRQVGISNFEPLRERFAEIYDGARYEVKANPGLPSLVFYNRRNKQEQDPLKSLPHIARNIEEITNNELQEAYKLVRANKLEDAVEMFKEILYAIVLNTVSTKDEVEEAQRLIEICREYILGLSIELERRGLQETDLKRNLELAAYFTKVQLQPSHKHIALQVAMMQFAKAKNFASAAVFARKFLELVPTGPRAEQARKIEARGASNPLDSIEVDYDPYSEFDICGATFTPIYQGSPSVSDPLTGTKYLPQFKGELCRVSGISTIGAPASGLRLII